jgi:hypothetical protein
MTSRGTSPSYSHSWNLASFYVAHRLHNETVTHPHQIDSAHGLAVFRVIVPTDGGPLTSSEGFFEIEMRSGFGGVRFRFRRVSASFSASVRDNLVVESEALFLGAV